MTNNIEEIGRSKTYLLSGGFDVRLAMGCLQSRDVEVVDGKAGPGTNGVAGKAGDQQCLQDQKGVPPTRDFTDIKQVSYDEIGLSYKQVFSLKQSWKGIKRKMEETGVEMFVR